MFEDFTPVVLVTGLPAITFTSNGATFSKAAIMKLGKPRAVRVLLNKERKELAIVACVANEQGEGATSFYNPNSKKLMTVRWNNKDFLQTIEKLCGWDLGKNGYKIEGEYFSNENALLFRLSNATIWAAKD